MTMLLAGKLSRFHQTVLRFHCVPVARKAPSVRLDAAPLILGAHSSSPTKKVPLSVTDFPAATLIACNEHNGTASKTAIRVRRGFIAKYLADRSEERRVGKE